VTTKSPRFLWLDLETTGLKPDICTILEVAAIVTNADLEEIDRFESVVAHDIETIQMARWPWKQHTGNGLLDDVALLFDKQPYANVRWIDQCTCDIVKKYSSGEKLRLAGSSVHFDRGFMERHMPQTLALLHHRQLDVSGFYEVADWVGMKFPETDKPHRAMADIERSLTIARHFKEHLIAR